MTACEKALEFLNHESGPMRRLRSFTRDTKSLPTQSTTRTYLNSKGIRSYG